MGTHCIEYGHESIDAYHVRQVALTKDDNGIFYIERHRGFNSTLQDKLPPWKTIRGSGITKTETVKTKVPMGEIYKNTPFPDIMVDRKIEKTGFYGQWHPHYDALMSECKLVLFQDGDRP